MTEAANSQYDVAKSADSRGSHLLACPICGREGRRLFEKKGYNILECRFCAHGFVDYCPDENHVNRIYQDSYFFGGKDGYPDYISEGPIIQKHGYYYGGILARYMISGSVFDVGAAAGFILKGLIKCGWRGMGLEPNRRMATYARENLGLEVEVGTLENYRPRKQFDLVSMIQVIAHFRDLNAALSNAARLTRPGGYWLIETWNLKSWTARLLGRHWHEFSPPSVLHWFSPMSLNRLASAFDFHEVACGRPSKWISASHAKALLNYKMRQSFTGKHCSSLTKLIPNKLNIPYLADDLFWILYRKETINFAE